jgi:hypothetical protein
MGNPTAFVDDSEVAARSAEVPNAAWDNGCNIAGSNAPGIGINFDEGAVVGEPQQFTLEDQNGNARTPQASAQIGLEDGDAIRDATNATQAAKDADPADDGTVTFNGNVQLATLAGGWENSP